MEKLDNVLKHYGIKGMKWGVRRSEKQLERAAARRQNGNKLVNRAKDEWSSLSRERQWKKGLKEINNLDTKDIHLKANRIHMENDLKRLSRKKKVGSKQDKKDYLNRANMDDKELNLKVNKLRAKESFQRAVSTATKEQREFGMNVVRTTGPMALQAAAAGNPAVGKFAKMAVKVDQVNRAIDKNRLQDVRTAVNNLPDENG